MKVNGLMKKLKTIKRAGISFPSNRVTHMFHRISSLDGVRAQAKACSYYKVRWGGAYKMLKAYFEIRGYLSHFEVDNDIDSNDDPDTRDKNLAHFIPEVAENETLKGLFITLETFQDANKLTQNNDFNILKARRLFNGRWIVNRIFESQWSLK